MGKGVTRRLVQRLLFPLLITPLFIALISSAPTAYADIRGPCAAEIAVPRPGFELIYYDANDYDSPGAALDVPEDSSVFVSMQSKSTSGGTTYFGTEPFAYHRIQLEFAGFRWTVSEKIDPGTKGEWSGDVNVRSYARFGVGLYKVIGYGQLTNGQDCIGVTYVKVTGRNPLTTVVGAAAAGVTAAGAAGVAAAGAAGAGSKKPEEVIVDEIEKIAKEEEVKKELDKELEDARRRVEALAIVEAMCFFFVVPALLLTGAAMVAGGGASPGSKPDVRLRRARWRPRISAVGLLGGLLAGAGAVVLLQQYALVYPTRAVAIEGLVGGLAVGLIVPSLMRIRAVRRVNRRIGWLERRLKEAAARQAPPPSSGAQT